MKTELKIIKHLIENKDIFTVRQLSKQIGSDYKITHTAVSRLIEKKIVTTSKIGSSNVVKFNNKLTKEVFCVEFERKKGLLKNKNLSAALDTIKEHVNCVNMIILLFGSYAKKKQTKNSDIDLMFIIPKKGLEKKIHEAAALLPLKIHSVIFTEKEFLNMKNLRKSNIIHEVMGYNVILYGIEQYYELLK